MSKIDIKAYPEISDAWDKFIRLEANILQMKAELDDFGFDDWLHSEDPGIYWFILPLTFIAWRSPEPAEFELRKVNVIRTYKHPKNGFIYRVFCSRSVKMAKDSDHQLIFGKRRFKSGNLLGLLEAYHTCSRCRGTGIPNRGEQPNDTCDCPGARGLHQWDKKGSIPIALGKRIEEFVYGNDSLAAADW